LRKLNELRIKLLDLVAQFDEEAHAEVVRFLKKYPSDTTYKINLITDNEKVIEHSDSSFAFNELPELVATAFIYASFNLKYEPEAPQPDRVELSFNYGKHVVVYEPHIFRLHYKVDEQIIGWQK
jgi:hypothetical protein